MSLVNFVRDSFPKVFAVDSEFRYKDNSKTIQDEVVCVVFQNVFYPKEVYKVWTADQKIVHPPFDFNDVLLVPFNAVAEAHSFLKLFWGLPRNVIDVYVENARLYKTFRSGPGALNLLTTAQGYGINKVMTKEHKEDSRNIIIETKKYNEEQREILTDYCFDDVELTRKVFVEQLEDIEQKNKLKTKEDYKREVLQMMFRGASQCHVAKCERTGVPIDYRKQILFRKHWKDVELNLIKRYNKQIKCFDEFGTLKYEKFEELVKRNNLFHKWPRTFNSGKLQTDKKTIAKYAHLDDFKTYKTIKDLQNVTKLSVFEPGQDGVVRVAWSMFGTETGRCTPKTNQNIFGGSKWQRAFIKPKPGYVLAYLDYSQQELAIQGYLSGDQKIIECYNQGDGYLASAKLLGLIPQHATKQSHPEERDIVKVLFLAQGYGAGPGYVASQVGCSKLKAQNLLARFKQLFHVYDHWIKQVLKLVSMTGKITTRLGWQRHSNGSFKLNAEGKIKSIRNTLLNFPSQGNGSDILRQALIKLQENHFEVCALVHDAVLIQIPIGDHEQRIKEAREIMIKASEFVVGGPIRVDQELIFSNWKQSEKDQKYFDEIFKEISTYCKNEIQPTPQ